MEPQVGMNAVGRAADVATAQSAPAPSDVASPSRNEANRGRGGGQRGGRRGGLGGEATAQRGTPRRRPTRPGPHPDSPHQELDHHEPTESVATPSRRGRGRGRGGRGGGKQQPSFNAVPPPDQLLHGAAISDAPLDTSQPSTPSRPTSKQRRSRVQEVKGGQQQRGGGVRSAPVTPQKPTISATSTDSSTMGPESMITPVKKAKNGGRGKKGSSQSLPTTPAGQNGTPGANIRTPGSSNRGATSSSKKNRSRARFDEYWPNDKIKAGLEAGTVFMAPLRVNAHRRREAYASIPGFAQDAMIDGIKDQNRAFEGDVVYLELIQKKSDGGQKAASSNGIAAGIPHADLSESDNDESDGEVDADDLAIELEQKLKVDGGNADGVAAVSSDGSSSSNQPAPKRQKARVVGIAEALHRTRQFIGTLRSNNPERDTAEFVPIDKRAPIFFVPLRDHAAEMQADPKSFEDKLFVVEFLRWTADSYWPRGRIVRALGRSGNLEAESLALLAEYSIDDKPHTDAMTRDLPTKMEITPYDIKARLDLRTSARIFSIDPPTTRDVDDALSIAPLGNGLWEVGVHIADVSHYVRPSSALDREAEKRSTSTYLVDRCIPMLPPILSEILCSINARQDRFAFSVIWKLTDEGIIKDTKITKTIIRSCAKLAYGDAQTVIDSVNQDGSPSKVGIDQIATKNPEADPAAIAQDILYLHRIAQRLRAARFASGAIKLNRVKLHFELDNTVTPPLPTSFQHYEQKTANELVEEYMLLANQSVAAFILDTFPKHSLLRRHPAPQERKLKEFLALMDSLKIPIDATSGSSMLASIAKQPAEHKALLEDLMTRTMQPAVYFCTGDVAKPEDMHHYALNVPVYTHFTSPIRRYPDVIVHRLIAAALDFHRTKDKAASSGTPSKPRLIISGENLTNICKNSNNRKLQARKAQERSQTVYLCIWLQTHPFTDEDTRVLEIGERYVKLYSHKIGKSVRVPVSALEDKGVKTKWSADTKTLDLSWKSTDGVEKSRSLTWFQQLSVKFSASTQVPMDLEATIQLDGLSVHLGELESE
eukprot:TRINITY_DN13641_c0_g1_i1.p1 TRINITY_DN13641_c0_g1~~TRINITY_DN13641_c0_g1_i1.p1  ORF type:complete len:1050 (-),score=196.29 TRINITY_DN13641_c0_g1_i1:12-3161(-)